MSFPPEILFEDKYLLAINKPCGVVVEDDSPQKNSLQEIALQYIRSKEKYPQKCFIGAPHRLDRPVSGVVLFAKKKSILKSLSRMFAEREITKAYWAIVENQPTRPTGELTNWLVKDPAQRKAIVHDTEIKGSVKAILQYKQLGQNENGALLELNLITGKYHQIRAQLAHIGCPVYGDARYGSKKSYYENAICLHAVSMELIHPVTNEQLKVTAHPPASNTWDSFKSI